MFKLILAIAIQAQEAKKTNLSCPQTFELVGKQCVKSVIAPAQVLCESGIIDGGKCKDFFEPLAECLGTVKDGLCLKTERVPKVMVRAPYGFKDNGTGYVKDVEFKTVPYCIMGELLNGNCVQSAQVPSVPKYYCADGSYLDSKGCQSTVSLSTVPICEEGTYNNDNCEITTNSVAELLPASCPEDFEKEGESCVKYSDALSQPGCEDGSETFKAEDGSDKCGKPVYTKSIYAADCPEGFEDTEGVCSKELTGLVSSKCPGMIIDGACTVMRKTSPNTTYECPPDFTPSAGKEMCYKVEKYDCTPPEKPNLLDGKEHGAMRGATHIRTVGQICEKKIAVDKIKKVKCPEGFELVGEDLCSVAEVVEEEEACSFPEGSVEACTKTEYAPSEPKTTCEDETAELSADKLLCITKEEVDPIEICAVTGKAFDDTCKTKVVASLMQSSLCDGVYDLGTKLCLRTISRPAKMVCENQNLPADKCFEVTYSAPIEKKSCPHGAVLVNGQCTNKKTFPPSLKCENGKSADECHGNEFRPYEYQCPHYNDIEEIAGECMKESRYPVELTCDQGELQMGKCLVIREGMKSCPNGQRLIGNTCYGKEFAEPTITYTKTCVGKGCDLL